MRRSPWILAALLGSACAQPAAAPPPEPPPQVALEPRGEVDLATCTIDRPAPVEALAFTRSGDGLVVAAGTVDLFALKTPQAAERAYPPPPDAAAGKPPRRRVAVCRDDRRLFVTGADQPVRAHALATGELLRLYPTSALGGWRVRLGPGGGPIVMDGDGHLKGFTLAGQLRWCYPPCEEDDDWLEDFDLAADGKLAVVALNQGRVILVDTATGRAEKMLAGVVDPRLVRFVPGAVIVGTKAGDLKRIDVATRREAWSVSVRGDLAVAAVAPRGDLLALAGEASVRIVQLSDGRTLRAIPAPDVTALAISPDGRWLARGQKTGAVRFVSLPK